MANGSTHTITPPERFSVLGMPVDLLTDYGGWLTNRLQLSTGAHVVTLNAEMVMQSEQNPELAAIIRAADLVIPDGAGVVLYLKLYGRSVRRCPGIELAERLITVCGAMAGSGSTGNNSPRPSVFFYGGAPGVAEAAAGIWQQRSPNLVIAGTQHGFLPAAEQPSLQARLTEVQPSLILVGLGVPRQELWIKQNRHLCPHAIWIGVGGSLDIWAGTKTRAPKWLGDYHLEWVYRLYQEPWRWRRMMALPQFAWRAIVERYIHRRTRRTIGQEAP